MTRQDKLVRIFEAKSDCRCGREVYNNLSFLEISDQIRFVTWDLILKTDDENMHIEEVL